MFILPSNSSSSDCSWQLAVILPVLLDSVVQFVLHSRWGSFRKSRSTGQHAVVLYCVSSCHCFG